MLESAIARNYAQPAMPTFGENVRRIRETLARITPKEAAQRARMSQPHWANLESKRQGLPEAPTLFRVAKTLGCSVEDLLAGIDPEYDELRAQQQRERG